VSNPHPSPQPGDDPAESAALPPDLVKIGDLARLAEVTPRTVRFYEDLGLIEPASRSVGGFRLYGVEQADRLRALLRLKEVGFSLDDIRAYRDLAQHGEVAFTVMGRLRDRISEGARQLRQRIGRLQEALIDLEHTATTLEACHGCDRKIYDRACHDCWKQLAGGTLPDGLKAVL
jgi:DNA-binding transcriptional MerR regulator